MPHNADHGIALQRKHYTETAERYKEMHVFESGSDHESFDQVAEWVHRIILATGDKTKPGSWMHPLLTSGSVILCATREW